MIKLKCKKCGKEMEGYTQKHVEYMMAQHDLTHKKEAKQNEKR